MVRIHKVVSRSLLALPIAISMLSVTPLYSQATAEEGDSQQATAVAAEQLMSILNDGLTGHNPRRFLSALDPDQMQDYSNFADQIRTFFQLYDNFRVHYRIIQVRPESEKIATVTADFELEAEDAHNDVPGIRRSAQLLLRLSKGGNEWKIADLQPREIFR